MANREEQRRQRENAARRNSAQIVNREKVRSALKAAAEKEPEDEAVEAISALLEDKLARLASRSAEAAEERREPRLSASAVAVAAQREAEERRQF